MNFKVGAGINIKCEDEHCRYLIWLETNDSHDRES